MKKHFLGTRGAFGLHRVGAEEEDVAVRVAGGDVEVVGAPLGVEDGAVSLGLAVGFDTVAVVEEDLGGSSGRVSLDLIGQVGFVI